MNIKIDPHFIQRVYVGASGDPSVGIPASRFEMEVWIDRSENLEQWRKPIAELYGDMCGEKVAVMFDFEYHKMCESEEC